MSQAYDDINATDLLSDSRQKIINRDDAIMSGFLGASEPSTTYAGMKWIDTSGTSTVKLRSAGNTSWYTIGLYTTELGHLPLSGGKMSGDLVLAGNPDANLKAAPKQYVDTAAQLGIPAGTVMLFYQVLAPTGWTKLTNSEFLDSMVVTTKDGDGGSSTGTISASTLPHIHTAVNESAHTHSILNHQHYLETYGQENEKEKTGDIYTQYGLTNDYEMGDGQTVAVSAKYTEKVRSRTKTDGTITPGTGAGSAHTHTINSGSILVKHSKVIVASKDAY